MADFPDRASVLMYLIQKRAEIKRKQSEEMGSEIALQALNERDEIKEAHSGLQAFPALILQMPSTHLACSPQI